MAAVQHDCPHCETKRVSFEVVSEYRPSAHRHEIHAFLTCGMCGRACVGVFAPAGKSVRENALSFSAYGTSHPNEFREIAFFPRPRAPTAPEHVPANVKQFFLEAVNNVKTGPNATGAMFRKTVDVALKHIDPDGKGKLVNRIDAAHTKGLITPGLKDWAHQVRLDGNYAAHDEDPFTPEEAETLHKFTELLLMYFFTLPGMLVARRGTPEGTPDKT